MTWKAPIGVPDLRGVKVMAIDTETYDPKLMTDGPGFITGDSYPIGISIATDTGIVEYYPIAHTTGNVEFPIVEFLIDQLSRTDLTIVGANTKYDLESMWKVGLNPTCKIEDCQVLEALLDENQTSYSLASIAKRRKLGDKTNKPMEDELIRRGWVKKGKPDYARLRELEPLWVGPYAAEDAALTLRIYLQQIIEIEATNLARVAKLESDLIPILWKMRLVGVNVNVQKAHETDVAMGEALEEQFSRFPKGLDPWSSASLAKWIRGLGYEPGQTDKGNDSISNEWLKSTGHPDLIAMCEWRQSEKIRRDFIVGLIMDKEHNGVIHPNWFTARGSSFMAPNDSQGTKSGRLSCTDPNLQQIPGRHPTLGKLIRSMFIPPLGAQFGIFDYQAQEIRLGIHFAVALGLDGAAEMAARYHNNPMLDYHTETMHLINKASPTQISRFIAKTANLSIQYGVGKVKLAGFLGMTVAEATQFLIVYHNSVPYIKQALTKAMQIAEQRGYVMTILGRRRHFNEWENAEFGSAWSKPLPKDLAQAKWGRIKRAGTYKAWNSVVQGSAAEQMKLAILGVYNEGILPMMTIHDELDVPIESDAQVARVKEIMENVLHLNVPVVVETAVGADWSVK